MTSLKRSEQSSSEVTCVNALLPAFSARLVFALRTLLGISCCAVLSFSSTATRYVGNEFIISLGFIAAMQNTLGATIGVAIHLFLGGTISMIYSICVINVLPQNFYYALIATNVFIFLVTASNLPKPLCRFSMLLTCNTLLQWHWNSSINTSLMLKSWSSISIGTMLSIVVLLVPLPMIPTAYRETRIRMRIIAQQLRREITGIALLLCEYRNVQTNDQLFKLGNVPKNENIDEMKIELLNHSYHTDDRDAHSNSIENLKRNYLLASDIKDLHRIVYQEIKKLERTLKEISLEPYFIFMKLFDAIKSILRRIPCLRKYIKKSSSVSSRLEIWGTAFLGAHRIMENILLFDHPSPRQAIGLRQLIHEILILIDATLEFLDATLPYTISSSNSVDAEHIKQCRIKIEIALESFAVSYVHVRKNLVNSKISNPKAVRADTFSLLLLHLVQTIVIAAETSETPGTLTEIDPDQKQRSSNKKRAINLKSILSGCAKCLGFQLSLNKFVHATKTALSVTIATFAAIFLGNRLSASNWTHWAPMVAALTSSSSEFTTLRASFQRLISVLLGSAFGYMIVIIFQDPIGIGISVSIFITVMGYLRTDPPMAHISVTCGQSISLIAFISNKQGVDESKNAALARTSLTIIGIFVQIMVSNLVLPVSAQKVIKRTIHAVMQNISDALKQTCENLSSMIATVTESVDKTEENLEQSNSTNSSVTEKLEKAEELLDKLPALLEEALSEPKVWKKPFVHLKDHYQDISKASHRIIQQIRFFHRCSVTLMSKSKLDVTKQLKNPYHLTDSNSQSTAYNTDSTTESLDHKQLEREVRLPLLIFVSNSTKINENHPLVSNETLATLQTTIVQEYEQVLQCISKLEKNIQQVISLTQKLIDNKENVDVGSFILPEFSYEDAIVQNGNEHLQNHSSPASQLRFSSVPETTSSEQELPRNGVFNRCCHKKQQKSNEPLPSLREAIESMLTSLIEFLCSNNNFIHSELLSVSPLGHTLAYHTLSYVFKQMVEGVADLTTNARRLKPIEIRTRIQKKNQEKNL